MNIKNLIKGKMIFFLIFILALLLITGIAEAEKLKLRVKVKRANIRSKPTIESNVILQAPLGAILDAEEKAGEWYKVNLPPDKDGVVVSGYIHQSIVEVVQEVEKTVEPEEEVLEKKEVIKPKEEKEKPPEVTPQVAEPKKGISGEKEFSKGSKYVTAQLGLNSYAIPFGASLEIAITENVGIGGSVMLQFWGEDYSYFGLGYSYSSTLITPAIEAAYHFTKLKVNKLDLSVGANIGFSIYSYSWEIEWPGIEDVDVGTSGLHLSPFLNGAYYFSPKTAIKLRVYFSTVGGWTGIGGLLGIIFKLK